MDTNNVFQGWKVTLISLFSYGIVEKNTLKNSRNLEKTIGVLLPNILEGSRLIKCVVIKPTFPQNPLRTFFWNNKVGITTRR